MVKDPVCGMEIDPPSAFAQREHMGQTFYFCSQNCVDQFDADPHKYAMAGSMTTGYNPDLPLARIELPIVGLKKADRAQALEAALKAVPGVHTAKINVGSSAVQVEYDAPSVTIGALSQAVKSAGYRVGGAQTRIGIVDLHCASCVKIIEDGLKATPGVLEAAVNVGTQEATIDYLPEKTALPQLRSAIEAVGYQPDWPAATTPRMSSAPSSSGRNWRFTRYPPNGLSLK